MSVLSLGVYIALGQCYWSKFMIIWFWKVSMLLISPAISIQVCPYIRFLTAHWLRAGPPDSDRSACPDWPWLWLILPQACAGMLGSGMALTNAHLLCSNKPGPLLHHSTTDFRSGISVLSVWLCSPARESCHKLFFVCVNM